MEIIPLKAKPRTDHGKGCARRLRAEGMLPSVAYGRGLQTHNLAVDTAALRTILISKRGSNTVIRLEIEGGDSFTAMGMLTALLATPSTSVTRFSTDRPFSVASVGT